MRHERLPGLDPGPLTLPNALKSLGGAPAERKALAVEEQVRGRLVGVRGRSETPRLWTRAFGLDSETFT